MLFDFFKRKKPVIDHFDLDLGDDDKLYMKPLPAGHPGT